MSFRSVRRHAPWILLCLAGLATGAQAFHGKVVATGLELPLQVTAPAGDKRLFIVEQGGAIKAWRKGRTWTFLDISAKVHSENSWGLLGMAFDPKYPANGRFYIDYVDLATGDTVVSRFTVSAADADVADPASEQVILRYPQADFPSHRAGWLGFRPGDRRNLYISTGDGSHAYDPDNNAQNPGVMLGKLLRVDVSGAGAGYTVPADNPFVGKKGVLPELWALGLRNPFRPSFDRDTGDFWIADVGQDTREELNFEAAGDPGGHNYGWRLREGTRKTPTGVGGPRKGMTDPVFDYPHRPHHNSLGDSITGGYVYRGPSIPDADGRYFFGDYVVTHAYSFTYDDTGHPGPVRDDTAALIAGTGLDGLSSYGEDGSGRLYLVGNNGVIVVMCPDAGVGVGAGARAAGTELGLVRGDEADPCR